MAETDGDFLDAGIGSFLNRSFGFKVFQTVFMRCLEKWKYIQDNTSTSLIAGKNPRVSHQLYECDVTYKEESLGRHLVPRGFLLLSFVFRFSHLLIKLQDEKIPIDNSLGIFGFPPSFRSSGKIHRNPSDILSESYS